MSTRARDDEPLSAPEAVLGLQATAGNAAVTAYLRGGTGGPSAHGPGGVAVQREEDDEEGGGDIEPGGETESAEAESGAETDTDPFDQAEADLEDQLQPGRVIDKLAIVALNDQAQGGSSESRVVQALAIQRDPPEGVEPAPKAGGVSDVIDALMPFLQPVLDRLKEAVLRDLRRIKAGEAVATVVVALPIVIGPLTQPGPRRLALDQLNGTDVTFGVVPNLKITPTITDGQLRGGTVTYDLAPFLRSRGLPF